MNEVFLRSLRYYLVTFQATQLLSYAYFPSSYAIILTRTFTTPSQATLTFHTNIYVSVPRYQLLLSLGHNPSWVFVFPYVFWGGHGRHLFVKTWGGSGKSREGERQLCNWVLTRRSQNASIAFQTASWLCGSRPSLLGPGMFYWLVTVPSYSGLISLCYVEARRSTYVVEGFACSVYLCCWYIVHG